MQSTFVSAAPFDLEAGGVLPQVEIAYQTYGAMGPGKGNVVWVCHALTGNSDAADWWSGLIGTGRLFDPERYFIVCANNLGSCYGTTGPTSTNPLTGRPYGDAFPPITIRDMVKAHQLLAAHIGVDKIHVVLGGSMGGQQALEWAIQEPERLHHIVLLASNAQHSPWGIAFNETQRMAIRADDTLYSDSPEAGRKGLEAARAIAMLSYRSYEAYNRSQQEKDPDKIGDYRASSYQRYQGNKLWKRFNPFSYLVLSQAMDSHHVGRNRDTVPKVLARVRSRTLIVGIDSDILFPLREQELMASYIPHARFEVIPSAYGHDGFLVEFALIAPIIKSFMLEEPQFFTQKEPTRPSGLTAIALPGTENF
ncbi:MAG: homoserine O-acetyltransferase [Haliscomenobacter sp.]